MLKTMATNKKYNKILLSITSSITILASFLMIFFVLKYNLIDISSSSDIKDSKSLVSLYAKNQIHKEVEFTSKIAIKNGCGIKHLGLIYKRYLLDLGYDVTEATNAIHSNGQLNFGRTNFFSIQRYFGLWSWIFSCFCCWLVGLYMDDRLG